MDIKTLYHGSDVEVSHPKYGEGKPDNDYGSGFYTTEDQESAKEWAVINGSEESAICNRYEIDLNGLNVLRLDDYGTLAWIAEVICNRGTDDEVNAEIGSIIVDKYKIDTSEADVIIGYRADDSYIKVVDAFLEVKLTIDEVDRMFRKGQLGMQVFIKSPKAFDSIEFINAEQVEEKQGYGDNEKKARKEVSDFLNARERAIKIEGFDVASKGLTVRDAINHLLVYQDGYYFVADSENDGPTPPKPKKRGTDYDPD